jgi:hypothetical protein
MRRTLLAARALGVAGSTLHDAEAILRRALAHAEDCGAVTSPLLEVLGVVVARLNRPHEARVYIQREIDASRAAGDDDDRDRLQQELERLNVVTDHAADLQRHSYMREFARLDPSDPATPRAIFGRLSVAPAAIQGDMAAAVADLATLADDGALAAEARRLAALTAVLSGALDHIGNDPNARMVIGEHTPGEPAEERAAKERHEFDAAFETDPMFDLALEDVVWADERDWGIAVPLSRTLHWFGRGVYHRNRSRTGDPDEHHHNRRAVWYLSLATAGWLDAGYEAMAHLTESQLADALLSVDTDAALSVAIEGVERTQRIRRAATGHATRNAWSTYTFHAVKRLVRMAATDGRPAHAARAAVAVDMASQDALAVTLRRGGYGARAETAELLAEISGHEILDAADADAGRERALAALLELIGRGAAALVDPDGQLPHGAPGELWLWISLEKLADGVDLHCLWRHGAGDWHAEHHALPASVGRLWTCNAGASVPSVLKSARASHACLLELAGGLPAPLLAALDEGAPLVIVGDSAATAVPWAALPLPSGRRLVDVTTHVLTPSFGAYDALRARAVASGGVIVAHSAFAETDAALGDLDPLAGASGAELAARLRRPTRLLLCAAHGVDADALAHGVILRDGTMLRAAALLEAGLTDKAWFSSCFAARPGWTSGVETWGLPAAALVAGARTAVGGIWPVPITDVARLTTLAIPALLDADRSGATALVEAQRAFLSEHTSAAPWRWATLAAVGS